MRRILLLTVASLALLAPTAGMAAKKPPAGGATTVSIAAAPTRVVFGSATTITGALSSKATGVKVTLEANPYPYTGGFKAVGAPAATVAGGTYSLTARPDRTTHYRVVAKPNDTSPEVAVAVAWKVGMAVSDSTPRKGARVRFSGVVHTAKPGGVAVIQRRTAAGWRSVGQAPLVGVDSLTSKYSVRIRVRSTGTYRARVAADAAHVAGVSRTRRLVTH